ncbi:MAG TPA: hypothetical protein VD735_00500 [Candidatus Saccharimonadales bacterium]|nr:hypothetical protein [Candidatus Saccharimonadales bacterium]
MIEAVNRYVNKRMQEQVDETLMELVGTPQQVAQLEAKLTTDVLQPGLRNPYEALIASSEEVLGAAADGTRTFNPISRLIAKNIKFNAGTGIRVTANALEALEDMYRDNAWMPQQEANVQRNMRIMLGYTRGLAPLDVQSAKISLVAIALGVDARHPDNSTPLGMAAELIQNVPVMNQDAFALTIDQDGQLSVRPKYRHMPPTERGSCPAANSRVEKRSSLHMFMQSMGNEAVQSIYPQRFYIAKG